MVGGRITVGFPRIHKEASERCDFLPPLVGLLAANGAEIHVETGIASGMGSTDLDYGTLSPDVHVTDEEDCCRQDIVVVLRAPRAGTTCSAGARCSCRCSTSRRSRRAWPC
jgi:alanine dehydrogenase